MTSPLTGQKTRSMETRRALMLAAEKLIADKGVRNVSIREIVKAAGQKNESALQYHFKNFRGLVSAIQQSRDQQIHDKRAELRKELLTGGDEPSLRDLCRLMALPTFLLAKADPGFRRYIVGFSHELALTPESALAMVSKSGGGGESGYRTGELLRIALAGLGDAAYRRRMETVIRLSAISMGHHARQKNAFRGVHAELFLNNLLDEIAALLTAPVSAETKALERASGK